MELRTLRYFLELARSGTISGAARVLHVTQPTLSRQLNDLEKELGTQLFERGARQIALTDKGKRLFEYAKTIVEVSDKAFSELASSKEAIRGDVYIGAGETRAIDVMHRAGVAMQKDYPHIRYHLYSGVTEELLPRFDSGFFDFLLECELHKRANCNTIELHDADRWGVVMRADCELASLERITPADLEGRRLITPLWAFENIIRQWAGESFNKYQRVATFSLPLLGMFLVRDGMGEMLSYERLIDTTEDGTLVFRELYPEVLSSHGIHWKKHRELSPAASIYLDYLLDACGIQDKERYRR